MGIERWAGRVALVTGASAGIGAAAARRFAAEGAAVVLVARKRAPLEALATELRGRGATAHAISADVGELAACRALVEEAVSEAGRLDVLVNNAGAHFRGPVRSRSVDEVATMIDVNVRAPLVLSRLCLPHLAAHGGAIVHVASIAGMVPLPDAATYSASKFALRAFSRALDQELAGTSVRSSVVSPGPILDTGFLMDSLEDAADVVFSQPMSTADEIAALILDAADGEGPELVKPLSSAIVATASYLIPGLRRALLPLMKARGKREKARLRAQRG